MKVVLVLLVTLIATGSAFRPVRSALHLSRSPVCSREALRMELAPGSVLEDELYLVLATKGTRAFEAATPKTLTLKSIGEWEREVESVAGELAQLGDNAILLQVYTTVLRKAAVKVLDPLEIASFEIMAGAIVDCLLRNVGAVPLTDLVDEITQVHLDYIDGFREMIDDGGEDGYSQSGRMETLTYQFAGLVRRTYDRVARGMGAEYDQSSSTLEMRLNNWVSPVYARLQRRFVRFLASNVEEEVEALNSAAMDLMLNRMSVLIEPYPHPKYMLASSGVGAGADHAAGSSLDASYPPWSLAAQVIKLIRVSVGSLDILAIDAKVARAYQNGISERLRAVGRPLERMHTHLAGGGVGVVTDKEGVQVTAALNLAHSVVAAVFTSWHIRCNVVGIPDPTDPDGVRTIKEFIQPMLLWRAEHSEKAAAADPATADDNDGAPQVYGHLPIVNCLPKSMRAEADFTVSELALEHSPSPDQVTAALVGHSVRESAMEQFRSLITYNSNAEDWPTSRDAAFVTVMAAAVTDYLTAPVVVPEDGHEDRDEGDGSLARNFYENMIAMCALEEAMAVREPRRACGQGLSFGLRNALRVLQQQGPQHEGDQDHGLSVEQLAARVATAEKACSMVMRLSAGAGLGIRKRCLRDLVEGIVGEATASGYEILNADGTAAWAAEVLGLPSGAGARLVASLVEERFDRAVGALLMGTDGGDMARREGTVRDQLAQEYRADVAALVKDLGMSDDAAEVRVLFLAGVIFSQVVEMGLQEDVRSGLTRLVSLMQRTREIVHQPLLDGRVGVDGTPVLEVCITMCAARLGRKKLVNVLNMIDAAKASLRGGGGGPQGIWTSGLSDAEKGALGAGNNDELVAYLELVQRGFLTAFSKRN